MKVCGQKLSKQRERAWRKLSKKQQVKLLKIWDELNGILKKTHKKMMKQMREPMAYLRRENKKILTKHKAFLQGVDVTQTKPIKRPHKIKRQRKGDL